MTLISLNEFQKEVTPNSTFRRTYIRSVYQIQVQVTNTKNRPIKVEYTQSIYYSDVKLIRSTNEICVRDGSSIKCKLALNADDEEVYSYNVEFIN